MSNVVSISGSPRTDLPLNYRRLRALLEAADEEQADTWWEERMVAAEQLQTVLWRMRRELINSSDVFLARLRPFAKVAQMLDRSHHGVILSLRGHAKRTDYVQLRTTDFFAAHDLVRRHGPRS